MNTRHGGRWFWRQGGFRISFFQVLHEDGVKTCSDRPWPVPSSLAKMNAEARARSATGWPDAALRTDSELVMRHASSAIPGNSNTRTGKGVGQRRVQEIHWASMGFPTVVLRVMGPSGAVLEGRFMTAETGRET